MLGKIFGILCAVSLVFGIACGRIDEVGGAVLDGASAAVTLTLSLVGIMCLWCDIMRVLERAGLISRLARQIAPLLRFYFPDTYEKKNGSDEIAANISANLLGIGNAATPLALSAMKKMQENNESPDTASDDMITLAVLNTSSISILPTTVIALRRAAGATDPFSIIVPVWIVSVTTTFFALTLTRLFARRRRRK